jgi:DNA-binding NtrC family response regulator
LRNIVERAVILADSDELRSEHIVLSGTRPDASQVSFFDVDLDDAGRPPSLDDLERKYIRRVLEFAGGNRTQVARMLGVSYPTVAKKITEYGLDNKKQ